MNDALLTLNGTVRDRQRTQAIGDTEAHKWIIKQGKGGKHGENIFKNSEGKARNTSGSVKVSNKERKDVLDEKLTLECVDLQLPLFWGINVSPLSHNKRVFFGLMSKATT